MWLDTWGNYTQLNILNSFEMALHESKKGDVNGACIGPWEHATRMPPVDIEFNDLTYTVPTGRRGQ